MRKVWTTLLKHNDSNGDSTADGVHIGYQTHDPILSDLAP